jgi:hypothetical protein
MSQSGTLRIDFDGKIVVRLQNYNGGQIPKFRCWFRHP